MTENIRPNCSKGHVMIKRGGEYGAFWGCSEYPECSETKKITQTDSDPSQLDGKSRYHEVKRSSSKWKELCWKNIVNTDIKAKLESLEKERTKYRMYLENINKMKPIDKPIGVYDESQDDPSDPVNINRKEELEKRIKENEEEQKRLSGVQWGC